jgi:hypothetical protein
MAEQISKYEKYRFSNFCDFTEKVVKLCPLPFLFDSPEKANILNFKITKYDLQFKTEKAGKEKFSTASLVGILMDWLLNIFLNIF